MMTKVRYIFYKIPERILKNIEETLVFYSFIFNLFPIFYLDFLPRGFLRTLIPILFSSETHLYFKIPLALSPCLYLLLLYSLYPFSYDLSFVLCHKFSLIPPKTEVNYIFPLT
jgi:hypothetical protein